MFLPDLTLAAQIDLLGTALGVVVSIVASFVVITMVASYFRFQTIVEQAERSDPEEMGTNAENVLRVQMARYLAACARKGSAFSVFLIRVDSPSVAVSMHSAVIESVKVASRRDDITCVYDEHTMALLAESDPVDAENVIDRIIRELAEGIAEIEVEQVRVGISSYPGHGLRGKDLLDAALHGLEQTGSEQPVVMSEIVVVEEDEDDGEFEDEEEDGLEEAETEDLLESEADDDEDEEEELVDRRRRRKSNVVDELTGVLKPSAVSAYMQRQMSELRRKKKEVALFCIGVNNVEHITRIHGEDAAEEILVGVSTILQENLRAEDLIGRHEKFGFLILIQASDTEAEIIGKRISTLVQQAQFTFGTKKLKTTITLGAATYPAHGRNLHQLYVAGQRVLDYNRQNDIRAYAVYDAAIHDRVPSKPMKSIKSVKA